MTTIGLVDGDPKTLRDVSQRLEAEGYKIQLYRDRSSALEGFEKNPPDLIILDVAMPRMDGVEMLRLVRRLRRGANVPLIFMTAKGAFEELIEPQTTADELTGKPFSAQLLVERIKAVLRRGSPASERPVQETRALSAPQSKTAELPAARYLEAVEQKVFSAALRRSVKVISTGG
jgi:two-component system, OmpR family, response regulator ChvI